MKTPQGKLRVTRFRMRSQGTDCVLAFKTDGMNAAVWLENGAFYAGVTRYWTVGPYRLRVTPRRWMSRDRMRIVCSTAGELEHENSSQYSRLRPSMLSAVACRSCRRRLHKLLMEAIHAGAQMPYPAAAMMRRCLRWRLLFALW